ncbi:hypothetical protein BH11CYA1_BH11CYA1_37170 [soil metagenome]
MHISAERALFAFAILLGLMATATNSSQAFDLKEKDHPEQSLHGNIINEALASTISPSGLKLVIQSCDQAEDADMLFNKTSFKRSLAYIEREHKKILNAAFEADSSPAARYRTLKHFGIMLRAVQDFYSNSNYVEYEVAKRNNKPGGNRLDPYSIDLIEWSKVPALMQFDNTLTAAEIKKNNSGEGQEKIGQATYYKVARELALRETARQWDVLATLLKNRYQAKSLTIITALKQASVPDKEPDEME